MTLARDPSRTSRLTPDRVTANARPSSRWGVAFGSRFFVALILGFLWMGPAWWNLRFLFAMAGWDVLVVLAWLRDLSQLPLPGQIEVSRVWTKPLAQAETSEVSLEIHCSSKTGLYLNVQDDLPASLLAPAAGSEAAIAEGQDAGGVSLSHYTAAPLLDCFLRPGETATLTHSIQPSERGDISAGGAYVRYQSPLKLAERWAYADLKQTVRVFPSLADARQHTFYLMRSRQIEQEKRLKRQRGAGREFETLREYRDGDELQDICWTATARRGKLITKVHTLERSQTVQIVLDAGRLMTAKVKPDSQGLMKQASGRASITLTKLDYAIRASLGIAEVALYAGDNVGILAYGRTRQYSLAPGRGTSHVRAIMESLATVRGELAEANHVRAVDNVLKRQRRRSLMIWLTDFAETAGTPEVVESAARLLRQHLVLFVAVTQPELAEMAARRPESEDEMYRYIAALEMIERRELLRRRLTQMGALAIELEPGKLAAGIISQYLEVKERGLL